MDQETSHHVRWKGAVSGPFTRSKIMDMLRSGELSLAHGIQSGENWMTLRQFIRQEGSSSESEGSVISPAQRLGAQDAYAGKTTRSDDVLDRAVREGYLWCGSTFLLPPAFGLLVWLWVQVVPETQPISRYVLLSFGAGLGCLLPLVMVRRIGAVLEQDGLSELRQAQGRLSVMLAGLGFVFWMVMFWFLKGGS